MTDLQKQYDPSAIEPAVTERWLTAKAFAAAPDPRERSYVIMMPLPNVTGALHMGHAMDNVMQDMLIRWHRMLGDNTLWMAGTDHAGIATQSVVEKRVFDLEGKTRRDLGRDELVRRIWAWKDQYQQRIIEQQQAMGCSCDWDRQRFTMDDVCARAVRWTFFRMFKEGLIYQGDRLVNWDCHLQTAVADDELYRETVQGHFWHLRYPVIDPKPGEPTHVVVATTRPETMLGDTAVACHPDPAAALDAVIERTRERLAGASQKDRPAIEAELEVVAERRAIDLPRLELIRTMARDGRHVMLPLQERPIPIIEDEWAKPELGSGCVKITPAHDPNDYEVWQRHQDEIAIVNIIAPDGTLNDNAGAFAGQERFAAREKVLAELDARGLIDRVEDREIEIDHSDRSKTIVEPYLSKQWFVAMDDVEGGVRMGRGTQNEFQSPGLAQAAIDAADGRWRSPTDRSVAFHPDQDRYHKIYHSWLCEKRDWCISRQLWWGHRIPVWSGVFDREKLLSVETVLAQSRDREDVAAWVVLGEDERITPEDALERAKHGENATAHVRVLLCIRDAKVEQSLAPLLRGAGLAEDPDVLDTWFSSATWPHSTLGWPDPATAPVGEGQSPLAAVGGEPDCLRYYYPGSCLVTGRDIVTLWVARMVVMGLYNLGDVPFTDVFLHANILDGRGERMSKSKGNGIDPMHIMAQCGADAMRYTLCEMQTGTQDIRLPVQAVSPFDGSLIDLAKARQGRILGTWIDPGTGNEFDVIGQMQDQGMPLAKVTSDRFDAGRNFCNKLWNAARFALMNLQGTPFEPRRVAELELEDRWILSRLGQAIDAVQQGLLSYNPSAALGAAREFFWSELCDWYLELIKPRMRDEARAPLARQVLAAALDQVLRLLHPFVPFITEELWQKLGELAPRRGIDRELDAAGDLCRAPWPEARPEWRDSGLERQLLFVQDVIGGVREVRARYEVPPKQRVEVLIKAAGASALRLEPTAALIANMAGAGSVRVSADAQKPGDAATAVIHDVEVFVLGVVDVDKERQKLGTQRDKLSGNIAGIERKLQNQDFVQKAPAAVVDQQRQKLADLSAQLASIEASLRSL